MVYGNLPKIVNAGNLVSDVVADSHCRESVYITFFILKYVYVNVKTIKILDTCFRLIGKHKPLFIVVYVYINIYTV